MQTISIILISLFLGIMLDLIIAFFSGSFKTKQKSKGKNVSHFKIKNFKIHHSFIGLICLIVSIFIYSNVLFPFSLGIILSHSIREKSLLFIEFKKGKISKKYF